MQTQARHKRFFPCIRRKKTTPKWAGEVQNGAGLALPLAQIGGAYQVEKLQAAEARKKQLESLGFVPGARVRVVAALGQSLIVEVKGARMALDGPLAQQVFVISTCTLVGKQKMEKEEAEQ